MRVSMVLAATQSFRCSVCRREDKTVQHGESLAGPGMESLAFEVKLPPGWHVLDGRWCCSLDCVALVLDEMKRAAG